jgi:hypothetical protein
MPRMLGRHDGAEGARYRRAWKALVAEYGQPVRGSLLALEMGRVAVTYSNLLAASEALAVARRARATGRGRRPSPAKIERLSRRHGLADRSYSEALEKLGEMAARHRPERTADDMLRELIENSQREQAGDGA